MRQLRQDMVHLEEQALHEEHHVLELIDIKKKLLRTEVSGTLLFNLHAFGSIIDHNGHSCNHIVCSDFAPPLFIQNDIHQLRQNVMHLDKQALEGEVQEQHGPASDGVCYMPKDKFEFHTRAFTVPFVWKCAHFRFISTLQFLVCWLP